MVAYRSFVETSVKRTLIGYSTCQSDALLGGPWPIKPSAISLKFWLHETKQCMILPGLRPNQDDVEQIIMLKLSLLALLYQLPLLYKQLHFSMMTDSSLKQLT